MASDHERYENDVGAYLLGALPALEAEVFERHLMGCDVCRDEVERLRPAVEVLPRSVEPFEPPPSLKRSLMAVVEAEAGERGGALAEPRRQAPGVLGRIRAVLGGMRPRTALAVASVALVAGAALGLGLSAGGDATRTIAATVDPSQMPGGHARLEVDGDAALLRVSDLPTPPPGRVYEVWVERDGMVRPAGALFMVDGQGNGSASIPGGVDGVTQVMVTREVAPSGADHPTERPVIQAEV
jgi:anti-sigma-K factor RskA/putative zinc finger protein